MRVYFATRLRSFFKHLLSSSDFRHDFIGNETYDLQSKSRRLLASLAKTYLFDELGYIQRINVRDKDCDLYGSFNRFLKSDKPYFIYTENPTALYHYRLRRGVSFLGRRRIVSLLNDEQLRAIVFMSRACADSFDNVCAPLRKSCMTQVIYPYVPINKSVSCDFIKKRSLNPTFKLLFISQGVSFIPKAGLEVIEAFKYLRLHYNILLHIITSVDDIDRQLLSEFRTIEGITVSDFKYSYPALEKVYASSHLLLQPTSQDSFGLTILEAMKSGLPVIATNLYAIPEMVEDGYNGYLTEPHYWFFDKNNIPNPSVWNHRKSTIYSGKISSRIVDFLVDKISLLYNDRALLQELSINSFNKANSAPFSEDYIVHQWNEFIDAIGQDKCDL